MTRFMVSLLVVFAIVAGVFVYRVKNSTELLERRHQQLARQIIDDQNAIKVLKAELAYLSRPARLTRLSARFLTLSSMEGGQIVAAVNELGMRAPGSPRGGVVDEFKAPLPRLRPKTKVQTAPSFTDEDIGPYERQAWLMSDIKVTGGMQ
ncbi:MAG: hypothetical protein CMF31_03215 [Kordiimonas sp.]|nr:hypothetical protein [Kordiimonas sp.]|tara:strand:- start:658 stop:1107 length:450 start_codon:yes stop_codon:yes gene_type:complete